MNELENLRAVLLNARQTALKPPADCPGAVNLRRALNAARKAFDPNDDKAYEKAEHREWLRRSDETCCAIVRSIGLELP